MPLLLLHGDCVCVCVRDWQSFVAFSGQTHALLTTSFHHRFPIIDNAIMVAHSFHCFCVCLFVFSFSVVVVVVCSITSYLLQLIVARTSSFCCFSAKYQIFSLALVAIFAGAHCRYVNRNCYVRLCAPAAT